MAPLLWLRSPMVISKFKIPVLRSPTLWKPTPIQNTIGLGESSGTPQQDPSCTYSCGTGHLSPPCSKCPLHPTCIRQEYCGTSRQTLCSSADGQHRVPKNCVRRWCQLCWVQLGCWSWLPRRCYRSWPSLFFIPFSPLAISWHQTNLSQSNPIVLHPQPILTIPHHYPLFPFNLFGYLSLDDVQANIPRKPIFSLRNNTSGVTPLKTSSSLLPHRFLSPLDYFKDYARMDSETRASSFSSM